MERSFRAVIAFDDRKNQALLAGALDAAGFAVVAPRGVREIATLLDATDTDLLLLDATLDAALVGDLLARAERHKPVVVTVLVATLTSLDTALAAGGERVFDYITRPFQLEAVRVTLRNAERFLRLTRENERMTVDLTRVRLQLEELTRQLSEHRERTLDVEQRLSVRQQDLDDSIRRMRGFHDRVLPMQFGPRAAKGPVAANGENGDVFERLKQAMQMRKDGLITEDDYLVLKKKILAG